MTFAISHSSTTKSPTRFSDTELYENSINDLSQFFSVIKTYLFALLRCAERSSRDEVILLYTTFPLHLNEHDQRPKPRDTSSHVLSNRHEGDKGYKNKWWARALFDLSLVYTGAAFCVCIQDYDVERRLCFCGMLLCLCSFSFGLASKEGGGLEQNGGKGGEMNWGCA